MEKYTHPEFVYLLQLYPEVGVHFHNIFGSWKKAKEWRIALENSLFPEGKMATNYHGYNLTFTISSSVLLGNLVVKGPSIGRRNKSIQYALWIPYSPVVNAPHPLTKLTEYFKQGVAEVLRKLEYPEESIQKVLEKINDKPIEEKEEV